MCRGKQLKHCTFNILPAFLSDGTTIKSYLILYQSLERYEPKFLEHTYLR